MADYAIRQLEEIDALVRPADEAPADPVDQLEL